VFAIPHHNGVVPRDSDGESFQRWVNTLMAQSCYRHLTADTNRFRMCDCDLSLVIDFDALIGR